MTEAHTCLWGWDGAKWVKLAVTGAGALVIDMAGISLDDIGNVNAPAPADGDALVWDDGTSLWIPVAMPAPGADYPMKLKVDVVRWVIPGWFVAGNVSTFVAVAGRIYYTPIFVSETTTYIRIGCRVKTGSAGTADLRIFNWSGGLPGSLVLSAGEVDTTAAGYKELVIAQELTRGYYFLAVRFTGTPTMYSPDPDKAITTPVQGFISVSQPVLYLVIPYVDAAYADPAPAPTSALTAKECMVILREN